MMYLGETEVDEDAASFVVVVEEIAGSVNQSSKVLGCWTHVGLMSLWSMPTS